MLEGLHDTMKPEDLHDLRPVYDLFPLHVFQDHIIKKFKLRNFSISLRHQAKETDGKTCVEIAMMRIN